MATRPIIEAGRGHAAFNDMKSLFKDAGRFYYTIGDAGGTDSSMTKAEFEALKAEADGVYIPLGKMSENIGELKFKQEVKKTDFHNLPIGWTVDLSCHRVTVDSLTVDFLDSDEAGGVISVLFVPKKSNVEQVVFIDSVTLAAEGDLKFNGDISEISMNFNASKVDKLGDCLKLVKITEL